MSFIKKITTTTFLSKLFVGATFFILFFFIHASVQAATLSLSPASGSYPVGKTFTVRVLVGSGGQSINAVSGSLSFSSDLLTLTGISKSSSIITLWAQDPTYSNSGGNASFQGVILNGYSGSSGTVVTLSFKAKAVGTANITLSNSASSVLLNDGQGTDVLSGTSGASYGITAAPTETTTSTQPTTTTSTTPVTQTTATSSLPIAPIIGSAPLFTDYQSTLIPGNFVVVKGTAPANSPVIITFTATKGDGTTNVTQIPLVTSADGTFVYVSSAKVSQGSTYTLIATTQDGQHTSPLYLVVKNSLWFGIATFIAMLLAIKIYAWMAILLILIISGYLLYRNHKLKKELRAASITVTRTSSRTTRNSQ